jgi:hypothetical protein
MKKKILKKVVKIAHFNEFLNAHLLQNNIVTMETAKRNVPLEATFNPDTLHKM